MKLQILFHFFGRLCDGVPVNFGECGLKPPQRGFKGILPSIIHHTRCHKLLGLSDEATHFLQRRRVLLTLIDKMLMSASRNYQFDM